MSMRAIRCSEFGGPEVLAMGTTHIPQAQAGTLIIKVKASGINPADLLQRRGMYPPPKGASEVIGLEVAGTVHEVGEGVSDFRVGDRVMALLDGGGYAEYAEASATTVVPLPKGYSYAEGAAIMEAHITAWQCLSTHGRPARGDVVLIHAAGGAVGIAAAVQARAVLGCTVVTTSSAPKAAKLKSLGIADFAVSRKGEAPCFAEDVVAAVGNDAVALIIDPVFGGTYLQEDTEVLRQDGTVVVIGLLGGRSPTLQANTALFKRASIVFSTLRTRSAAYKADLVASFARDVLPHLDANRPIIDRVVPIADVIEAHKAMEGSENFGKIVLEW